MATGRGSVATGRSVAIGRGAGNRGSTGGAGSSISLSPYLGFSVG